MRFRLIIILAIMAATLQGQTIISGNVSGTWDSQGSPYQLEANTVVLAGDTLIIEANTSIDFSGRFELRIRGTLMAHDAVFSNGGELFSENGRVSLNRCHFLNLAEGISIYGGQTTIEDCLIDSTLENGITFSGADSSYIRRSHILNSGGYGIKLSGSDFVEIYGNVLKGNSTQDFSHPALFIDSCSPQIVANNLVENNHAQGIGVWTLTAIAAPVISNNLVRGNYTGITIVNSPAFILDNVIVANYQEGNFNSGAGIYAGYPSARGIIMGNYIGGNYAGISNISNANMNMGDMVNDYPGDDGLNLFYDNSFEGTTWHIWNGTSSQLLAQNNYWLGLDITEVDATLHDNEEGAGEIIFEPIYAAPLPDPPDINNDETVNILDIIVLIENVLTMDVPEPIAFYLSDINHDYTIDVNDILELIDLVIVEAEG